MSGREPELPHLRLEFARVAASSATVHERAATILQQLGRILPFDAGWLALRDPERHRHVPLATTGAAEPLRNYFGRPEADEEVELLGLSRRRQPMLASEVPSPLAEVSAWADHLLPAGFRQGLAAPLFAGNGRHIGFLSLLSTDPSRPNPADRRVVAAITTVIAHDLDRIRDVAETARIVENAGAGVVLTRGGGVLPLPGLPGAPCWRRARRSSRSPLTSWPTAARTSRSSHLLLAPAASHWSGSPRWTSGAQISTTSAPRCS
jgi:hypothetical protein